MLSFGDENFFLPFLILLGKKHCSVPEVLITWKKQCAIILNAELAEFLVTLKKNQKLDASETKLFFCLSSVPIN